MQNKVKLLLDNLATYTYQQHFFFPKAPFHCWVSWIAQDIIPALFSFPIILNVIGYILFYSQGNFLLPLNYSIIGLILSILLYAYQFLIKRAQGKTTKFVIIAAFSTFFFITAFSINSYNELFNEFFIVSRTKVDYVFLFAYFLSLFGSSILQKPANTSTKISFLPPQKMPTITVLFFIFILFFIYSYFFTNSLKMGSVKCNIDSDCPVLENNPESKWNCVNFCGDGQCQFKCTQTTYSKTEK